MASGCSESWWLCLQGLWQQKAPNDSPGGQVQDSPPIPIGGLWLCLCWCFPAGLYWVLSFFAWRRRRIVWSTLSAGGGEAAADAGPEVPPAQDGITVMLGSIEHSLHHLPNARAVTGGLGKVMDLIARHHPTDIKMVHPMVKQGGEQGKDYCLSPEMEEAPLRICVDGRDEVVRVWRHTVPQVGENRPTVEFLLLSHDWLEERTKETIYPNPMTRRKVLKFYSLWNQAVGELIARHRPSIFHCPDYHTALAPLYAQPSHRDLRVLLVLHNAEYQGGISTDMMRGGKLQAVAEIFNLPPESVQRHLLQDGRFNMLKAAVSYVQEKQAGVGICAVSRHYALECKNAYSLLWKTAIVEGIDNPMLEEERAEEEKVRDLAETKRAAKARIQDMFGLEKSPGARLFVFVGRMVRQKGVDLIADVAPWLLSKFADAQLIVIGPVCDGFGHYTQVKMGQLAQQPEFSGRIHTEFEFARIPEDMKFAADFCLMPSRDEPFGYVDVEFAWRGAVIVGAQAGGLGKVPGFYYVAQNRENLSRLRHELRKAISLAMGTPSDRLERMAQEALGSSFPVEQWKVRLLTLYESVLPRRLVGSRLRDDVEAHPHEAHPLPCPRGRLPVATPPVSMVDSGVEVQSFRVAGAGDTEFLKQEPTEDELSERVVAKLEGNASLGIDEVLEMIGADLDVEAERAVGTSNLGIWLAKQCLGSTRVHWLVSLGYLATPIASLLATVVATEWGVRGSKEFPHWFTQLSWFKRVFGTGGLDPILMNMLLFSSNALASAIGAPIWAELARRVQPRVLLASCLLLHALVFGTVLPVQPTISLAVLLVLLQGFASSGSFLFVSFNFMMSIKADMSHAALRMGILDSIRSCVTWLLTGYVFLASPADVPGPHSGMVPVRVTWLLLPLALATLSVALVPGLLCLAAPGPYRDDRLPGWGLDLMGHRRTFVILALSDCVGSLVSFPSTCFVTWWLANGWTTDRLSVLSVGLALFLAVGTGVWAKILSEAVVHGYSLLIGAALLLAPATLLRTVVLEEVSTFTFLGQSRFAVAACVLSLFLEGVRGSAIWAVKIRVLNSRWRLLSYASVFEALSNLASVVSPVLCEWIARMAGSTFITGNQKELADAMIACAVPICTAQFLVQMLAAPFVRHDMCMASSKPRGGQAQGWPFRNSLALLPMAAGVGLLVAVAFLRNPPTDSIATWDLVRPCHLPILPNCSVLAHVTDNESAVIGQHYGPNRYGMSTTGKFNCLQLMRSVRGNTFVFWPLEGRCQVQYCQSSVFAADRKAEAIELHEVQVWSEFCNMSGQNLVSVHLFEWPWRDIARECEDYLGPAGFSMVQVSPPQEHVLGYSWYVRYQPVSYKLESRAGTEQDFVDMVSRCEASGVAVMVDVVLNHMAGPYVQAPKQEQGKTCGGNVSTAKVSNYSCVGWAGTQFGNRVFSHGRPGIDAYNRSHFHHYLGNDESNCGLPPWTNNRHLCDLTGLPDLNTEALDVQEMLRAYLKTLFEMGVRMLRIDAAVHMYPESIAKIVGRFPFDYIVQEMYPAVLQNERDTAVEASAIGSYTNFDFGQQVAERLFDAWDGKHGKNRSAAFGDLLNLTGRRLAKCTYDLCDSVYEDSKSLVFLDNHDQQRQRWKEELGPPPESPVCEYDGKSIGQCRPIYKHGLEYHLAQLFMLAWPYGDAVRLMSSYAWELFDQGPPGVRPDSLHDVALPVVCRETPTTSPVTAEYDGDQTRPWACEHRWAGVAALVRFRRLVGRRHAVRLAWADEAGRAAFSLGGVGFVAMCRGYNWVTEQGNHAAWNLTGRTSGMPAATYCNLAALTGPLPPPSQWDGRCSGDAVVVVAAGGAVAEGAVPAGGVVAIHADYRYRALAAAPPSQSDSAVAPLVVAV